MYRKNIVNKNVEGTINMKEKQKGLIVIVALYCIAFIIAAITYNRFETVFAASAVFTAVATLVVFLASCIFSDVSMYDPYWSVAPFVMLIFAVIRFGYWSVNAMIMLAVVGLWSIRLTVNWYITYKGIGNEDWRYAMYRKKLSSLMFLAVSFFGLHFMPTVVVYAALVSGLYAVGADSFSVLSLPGLLIMFLAILLEFVSDRSIHGFLEEHKGERKTCDVSVWKYSRHPNYLGEMSFWTGMYLYFLPLYPEKWYFGLGCLSIIALFLIVSIPMMEKHNMERREDYAVYKEKTSMLLLLPSREK